MQHVPGAFFGNHTFGELYDIAPQKLNDIRYLTELLCASATKAGATVCGTVSKQFEPQGVTVLVLLEESHASFHTYPEIGALFFDMFTCGDNCNSSDAFEFICSALDCSKHEIKTVKRGFQ
ncbi:S-adenosylmethionine decarboxylase proenzyme [Pseudomonas fluorescens]|jgi:S-adenosylmethionine decarboxylase|uniref:adenosylmethionine decarboxylase n=1 Tax=Pseudomonas fluorescens TaxID=294 RepID=UPI0012415DE8|nr:adenosylmethionine decarboxylase [Pseudomonas fluorescens]VVP25903.1 S-adenosylmethionine decarboxylase proenzyme [Pseudomonas fluorescens]